MMDRRRFARAILAAVLGVRVADELMPAALPASMSYHVDPDGDHIVPWPASPVTDEQIKDAGGYLVRQEFAEWLSSKVNMGGNRHA